MADLVVVGGIFREVHIRADGHRQVRLAGSGLYASLAAARSGASVELFAPVGMEDVPIAEALCAENRVCGHWLTVGDQSATFVTEAAWWKPPRPLYKPAGSPAEPPTSIPKGAPTVLVFGHPEWEPERCAVVADLAEDALLLWDRQGWLSRSPGSEIAASLPARQKILLANISELAEAWHAPAEQVLEQPVPAGFQAYVAKDGPWGVHLRAANGASESIPARRVHARGSIGSGDVFAGAMAAGLAAGQSLVQACKTGTQAAAQALASADPLYPEPIATPAVRPIVTPAQRIAVRAVVQAAEPWAAQLIADTLTDAFGIRCSPQIGDAVGGIRLTLHHAQGRTSTMLVRVQAQDSVMDELGEALLGLAAEVGTT